MHQHLDYITEEKLKIGRPVDRIAFIANLCRGRRVLDIGCFDETALVKRDTEHWLHGRISELALEVVGLDNSEQIPPEGLTTAPNAAILRGDGVAATPGLFGYRNFDLIVAGEFIEHIDSPVQFLTALRQNFPGKELLISTPNGVAFGNTFVGIFGREIQHPDHLHVFTFKILHSICKRAGINEWEIIPYRFFATEMILRSHGLKRVAARSAVTIIRFVERLFPLLSFGYIVRIRL